MGSRTRDLPELGGIAGIIREMRYHEFSRQAIGILLIVGCILILLLGR